MMIMFKVAQNVAFEDVGTVNHTEKNVYFGFVIGGALASIWDSRSLARADAT